MADFRNALKDIANGVGKVPPVQWGVFEYATGTTWHVTPSTEARARYEVAQLDGGYEAWPLDVCMAMTNAFAHGRVRGHKETAEQACPSVHTTKEIPCA